MSQKRLLRKASTRQAGSLAVVVVTLLALPGTASAVDTVGFTEQVNVSSQEEDGNGFSEEESSLSADGRFVAFHSDSDNLVPNDTNGGSDVFVRDRLTGTTERVSVSSNGKQAADNSGSLRPSISADGRYVAFDSSASKLAKGDKDNATDVFVHDRLTRATTLVSVASDGTDASGFMPMISGNGRCIGFLSDSAALGGDGFSLHVFVRDRQTGTTEQIDLAPDGSAPDGDAAFSPQLSDDGRFVFFTSLASNLTPGVHDEGGLDAFLYDRTTGTMTAITSPFPPAFVGTIPHGVAEGISASGRYLTFTGGDGFIEPDTNGFSTDAWLVDTATAPFTYTLVSRNDAGEQADEISTAGPVSNDGTLVAFESRGTNLDGPARFGFHVYLRDVQAGTTRLVSIPPGGGEFDVESTDPSMTPDGDVVGFHNITGVFVRDMR